MVTMLSIQVLSQFLFRTFTLEEEQQVPGTNTTDVMRVTPSLSNMKCPLLGAATEIMKRYGSSDSHVVKHREINVRTATM